jgi:hypothetical protein
MYPTPEHSEARVFPVSGGLSDARLYNPRRRFAQSILAQATVG